MRLPAEALARRQAVVPGSDQASHSRRSGAGRLHRRRGCGAVFSAQRSTGARSPGCPARGAIARQCASGSAQPAAAPAAAVPSQAAATAAEPPPADVAIPPPAQKIANPKAVFSGLDKITGRTTDMNAPAGVPVRYGSLIITAQYCYTVPPEQPPETTAFVQIDEEKPGQTQQRVFSGWMFASSPALNALEHPTYDVWVITCKTEEPVKPAAPDSAEGGGAPAPANSGTAVAGPTTGPRK